MEVRGDTTPSNEDHDTDASEEQHIPTPLDSQAERERVSQD
jgi:hypothetical protein